MVFEQFSKNATTATIIKYIEKNFFFFFGAL